MALATCRHYHGYPKPATQYLSSKSNTPNPPTVSAESRTHGNHPVDAHRAIPQATQGRYKLEANKVRKRRLALRATLTFGEILECVLDQPSAGRNPFLQSRFSLTRPFGRGTTISGCDVWQRRQNVSTGIWLAAGYYGRIPLPCLLVRFEIEVLACGWA
jgi:hypothetical protein